MKKVVIIQSALPHYRVAFFELLRERLQQSNILLSLIHGEHPKNPTYLTGDLEWATPVKRIQLGPFSWHQDTLKQALNADLVISSQEIRHIIPLIIQLSCPFRKTRFAYWGHGKSFQAVGSFRVAEILKRWMRNHADWWFAYNDLSARLVIAGGFPASSITSVRNSIDMRELALCRKQLTEEKLLEIRNTYNIRSNHVAIFAGGMVPNKRFPFLIEALHGIRSKVPDFEMIFIGGGTERHLVTEAARQYSWIHDIGPLPSTDTVPFYALSKLMLMPGLVGLVILDTFVMGVPMITTDFPCHSPEIDYLEDGVNGIMVHCGDSAEMYANAVVELLNCPETLESLQAAALRSAESYSIENMAENFANGVVSALRS